MELSRKRKILYAPGFSNCSIPFFSGSSGLPKSFNRKGIYFFLRGSTALWSGLKLLPLKRGETVLFPSYHCGIELDVILKAGFEVQFYHVDSSLRIDMEDLRCSIGSNTRALYVIHYFGFSADMKALKEFCNQYDLLLIEDCALALYAQYQEEPLGSFGDIAIFSIRKTLTVPAGGALVVNNENLRPPNRARPNILYEVLKLVYLLFTRHFFRTWLWKMVNNNLLLPLRANVCKVVNLEVSEGTRKESSYASIEFLPKWQNVGMSRLSIWLFKAMQHEQIVERRRSNFQFLLEVLNLCSRIRPLITTLQDGACPLVFPVTVTGDASAFVAFCQIRGVSADPFWRELHPKVPGLMSPEMRWLKENVWVLPIHQSLNVYDLLLLKQTILDWEESENRRPLSTSEVSKG